MLQNPPVPEPMIKTLVPVISAFIGGLIGITGTYMALLYQRRSERKSINAAFAGEIYALLEIVEKRDYVGTIERAIKNIRAGSRMSFSIPVTQTYFNVYFKNLDKIGLLKAPLSSKIVMFYAAVLGILDDFKILEDATVPRESDEQYIGYLNELKSIIEYAQNLGWAILKQSGRHWRKQAANRLKDN